MRTARHKTVQRKLLQEDRQRRILGLLRREPSLTYQQLAYALEEEGCQNPELDQAWSKVTIHNDIRAIRERLQAELIEADGLKWIEWQWMHIQGALRLSYLNKDPLSLVKVLQHHARLFGLTSDTIEIIIRSHAGEAEDPRLANLEELTEDELTQLHQDHFGQLS